MNKKVNALDVLSLIATIVQNLCGNIAGGALLANALYGIEICRDDKWKLRLKI